MKKGEKDELLNLALNCTPDKRNRSIHTKLLMHAIDFASHHRQFSLFQDSDKLHYVLHEKTLKLASTCFPWQKKGHCVSPTEEWSQSVSLLRWSVLTRSLLRKGKSFLSSFNCISPLSISDSKFVVRYGPVPNVFSIEHAFLLSNHKP